MGRYAMNINDGRVVFNSEAVATNVNYTELDDDIHAALKSGKLTWQVIANAVRAKRNNDPNFDWAQYDLLRDRLNIRKAKFDLKSTDGKDVTGVGDDGKPRPINPSVSFIELNRTDTGGASTKDNTNVGVTDNFISVPGAMPASEIKRKAK